MNSVIPKTDLEVIDLINKDYESNFTKKLLIGIYECRRGIGETVLQAYETALRAHIEASDKSLLKDKK